jgi:hypothetical protein
MTDAYPAEPTNPDPGPPPALRLAGSPLVHATSILPGVDSGHLVFPACGISVGRRIRRIAVYDPDAVDCPTCDRIVPPANRKARP